ncbi:hypothetical protein FKP32DRAFT_1656773 [Trametes sanguinea]|nr:hypothetical protein FKP32DRAFT_1656773 [Trametes sanguinea]
MSFESDNPPWFVRDSNGGINILEVPPRLKSHPEVIRRGLELEPANPMKVGVVYVTRYSKEPVYVVKILDTNTEEREINQRLLQDLACPRNHTIPAELTPLESGHPLLIMPWVLQSYNDHIRQDTSLYDKLGLCLQVLEGVEYLHDHRIAHLDICLGNFVASSNDPHQHYPGLTPRKVYIIDFGCARQLPLGPGVQPAIELPSSQMPKPNGLKYMDPYSWDVYCTADIMRGILEDNLDGRPLPTIPRLYIDWVSGRERGCMGPCHCRPTARRARQVLVVLRWVTGVWEYCKRMLQIQSDR